MIRLTRAQVREIDRLSLEKYKIPGIVLMENASRAVADEACNMLNDDCLGQVIILCGGGNNGGDGLAVARHLHNRGAEVNILLTSDSGKYVNEARSNWEIVQAMNLKIQPLDLASLAGQSPVLLIDAIFGTGLSQTPREPFAEIVRVVSSMRVAVLAVDLPSGLDCDTGKPLGACISATRTVTFVAEKIGFAEEEAQKYLGRVTVGDIGCPKELIEAISKASIQGCMAR